MPQWFCVTLVYPIACVTTSVGEMQVPVTLWGVTWLALKAQLVDI